MRTVLIVDDHPMIRFAAKLLLEQQGMKVVAETDNGVDALNLARLNHPDIVVLDIGIPKLNGLDVIDRLRNQNVKIKIVVLTSLNPAVYANRCMLAGASGFVCKDNNLDELIRAIRAVMSGFRYFPDLTTVFMHKETGELDELPLVQSLSDRELSVLKYLSEGFSNMDIAERMLISHKTVSTYKTRLMTKLNAHSLVDLIEFARRNAGNI